MVQVKSIHFIHQKGKGENPIPLLLIHGFPDSFVRFLKIIPRLTEVDENGLSFDLVIPSIPGYGFSNIPKKPGMDTKEISNLFNKLMTEELGYKKYLVQGGDWVTSIAEKMALYHDGSLIGMHLTDVPFSHLFSTPEGEMTNAEIRREIFQCKSMDRNATGWSLRRNGRAGSAGRRCEEVCIETNTLLVRDGC